MASGMMLEDFADDQNDDISVVCELPPSKTLPDAVKQTSRRTAYISTDKPTVTEELGTKVHQTHNAMPAVINLNVGGCMYATRLSTLCKYEDCMLAAMFSGRHALDKDADGNYFIDSNGRYFGYILDFLRHETLPPLTTALAVYKEACYYNLTPLVERLQTVPEVARMVVREAHRAQFPGYNSLKQHVIRAAVKNATVTKTGEVLIYAFRKEFRAKAPYFNHSHDCVANSADVTVGPWESPPDEEILIRSLEQDLTEEGFNIKAHEQKKRCKYYNGQNCQKAIYRISFLFT